VTILLAPPMILLKVLSAWLIMYLRAESVTLGDTKRGLE
jgi:hypothetical protein